MIKVSLKTLWFPALAAVGLALARARLAGYGAGAYPPLERLQNERFGSQDAAIIAAGFREAAADVAWVQLLQYMGSDVLSDEGGAGAYERLKPLTLRVVRLDPGFLTAYSYGAGILAWFRNVNRPQEAAEILEEGIANHPERWQLRALLAAIAYQQRGRSEDMLRSLERSARDPACPTMIKSILANLYKARGEYAKAEAIWASILENDAPEYREQAKVQLERLRALERRQFPEKRRQ